MWETLKKLAPTVASALGGPLAGAFVAGLGEVFGQTSPTIETITKHFEEAQLTPEQIVKIKELELKAQQDERENGFKYAELAVRDRESARQMMVATGAKTPAVLTWVIVTLVLTLEGIVLFHGTPDGVSEIVLGRVLGTLDTALGMVLAFWFGTTHGSQQKTTLLAQVQPSK